MRAAITVLRERIGRERPIIVYHTDLPGNDFSTLIGLIDSDPESYGRDDPAVFPFAMGRSFYRSVFPPAHVDLGWSSYAAVWLSQIPRQIPDHFFILAAPVPCGPSSIDRRRSIGRHFLPCAPPSCGRAADSSSRCRHSPTMDR
jgi:S-adenosylmethionine-dependent carboxyl methyltransferase